MTDPSGVHEHRAVRKNKRFHAQSSTAWSGSATPSLHNLDLDGDKHVGEFESHLIDGADVDERDRDGATALYLHADQGHAQIVKLLLQERWQCDVNANDHVGRTALQMAAKGGHTEAVAALLAAGANADHRDEAGETALYYACAAGSAPVARLLLEAGADVQATASSMGWSALHAAAWRGHLEVVLVLNRFGADPHAMNHDGRTALDVAHKRTHAALLGALADHPPSQATFAALLR